MTAPKDAQAKFARILAARMTAEVAGFRLEPYLRERIMVWVTHVCELPNLDVETTTIVPLKDGALITVVGPYMTASLALRRN